MPTFSPPPPPDGRFPSAHFITDPDAVRQASYYSTPAGRADLRAQGRLLELLFVSPPPLED